MPYSGRRSSQVIIGTACEKINKRPQVRSPGLAIFQKVSQRKYCSTCKFKFCRCLYILKLQFTRGVVAKWSLALLVRENRWRPKDRRFTSRPRRSLNKFTVSTFLECQNHLFPLSQSSQCNTYRVTSILGHCVGHIFNAIEHRAHRCTRLQKPINSRKGNFMLEKLCHHGYGLVTRDLNYCTF